MKIKQVLDSINSRNLRCLLKGLYHRKGPGRKPYNPLSVLKAQLLKHLLLIPSDRRLALRLKHDRKAARACGFRKQTPSHSLFTQFRHRLGKESYLQIFHHLLQRLLESGVILGNVVAIDSTHIKAYSQRSHDNQTGRSDPDARVGQGKRGFYLGYQSLFLVDIEGFPLGHEEAPANVNEKEMVEPLLDRVLGEDIEVELTVADSQIESQRIFDALEARKIGHIIAWRRMPGRENPPDVLTVKDRIHVEGPEWKKTIYHRLRSKVESLNSRVKNRVAYSRLTWQGLENASIHVSLVLMVVYAAAIAATLTGRPELRYSIAYFA